MSVDAAPGGQGKLSGLSALLSEVILTKEDMQIFKYAGIPVEPAARFTARTRQPAARIHVRDIKDKTLPASATAQDLHTLVHTLGLSPPNVLCRSSMTIGK